MFISLVKKLCVLVLVAKGEAFSVMRPRTVSPPAALDTTFPPRMSNENASNDLVTSCDERTEKALFGMGCFWAPQEEFNRVNGVVSATSGYASVIDANDVAAPPSYLSVCSGDGRTEAVLVEYVPSVVSYPQLLQTFWLNHDASTAEKPQYRSVIWPLNEQQREVAIQDLERATEAYRQQGMQPPQTIVPQVSSAAARFVKAESIHQHFWTKLRLKMACLACATLFTTTQTQVVGPLVSTVATRLVLLWVIWEVSAYKVPNEIRSHCLNHASLTPSLPPFTQGVELMLASAVSFGLNRLVKSEEN